MGDMLRPAGAAWFTQGIIGPTGYINTSYLGSGTANSSTFLRGDGAWATPAGGSPGGSDTQIQYNNAGAFAGSAKMVFDGTNLTLDMSGGLTLIGDAGLDGTGTRILLSDSGSGAINLDSTGGIISIGDAENVVGNMVVVVNAGANTFTVNGRNNLTVFEIDDTNQRATFNKKAVLTDTGSFYIYDAGTSTYWKWESVSGSWTGTDTGSASLP